MPNHPVNLQSNPTVQLNFCCRDGGTFQVNGYRLKEYLEFVDLENVVEEVILVDPG